MCAYILLALLPLSQFLRAASGAAAHDGTGDGSSSTQFTHPGVLVSAADLDTVRAAVASKTGPKYVA
eukprot:COSAG02_NODE_2436_length_8868_cov_6.380203_4_plen_66_part_01